MGILWNVWPWPWASPVLMQQLRQRNYWEDNYRRVRHNLQAQEDFSASIWEQNRTLRQQVANLQNENMAAAEKSRRQEQLLLEARNEASRKDKEHRQNLNTLYARLHTLQSGPTSLTDDDVQERMRRLVFELDSWIKSNFRNSDWPAYITERMEFPRTYPQRRAWIHAHIVQIVDRLIFSPSHCGMSEDPFGGWIAEIENSVKQTSTEAAFQNWKMATGTAIEKLTTEQQNGTLAFIIDHIEELFCALAPTVSTSRKQQLRMFLEDCLSLKNALARQPDSFTFFRSPPGADFSAESMTSFGGDGNNGGTVMLSLWPALVKYDGATYVVIDRELVWTTD